MQNKKVKTYVRNYSLLILGAFILAFGNVFFLTKQSIVAGGSYGIAVIIQFFVTKSGSSFQGVDIFYWSLCAFFWLISLIFIGKKFAFRTLIATIFTPLFSTLFLRVFIPYIQFFGDFYNVVGGEAGAVGNLILCGLFGGLCVGLGVSVAFMGGGSSGGTDALVMILKKYLNVKESIGSVATDAAIILIGLFSMQIYVSSLCGILCAVVTALVIEFIYIKRQSGCQADIISEKYEEISAFVQNELGRGATIISATGGYKGDPRPMLRVVIDKSQYRKLKEFLSKTDPSAFVTFTITKAVYGEGFDNNHNKKKSHQKSGK